MNSSQKARTYFLAALVAISIVVVLPTFLRDKLPTSWPGRPIKLGLDLRGGSYLVLGVVTKEAVKSHLVTLATSVKGEMRKEKVGVLRSRQIGERSIEITLLNEKGADAVDTFLRREEPGLTRTNSGAVESNYRVTYDLSDSRAKEIEKQAVEQAIETVRRRVDQYGVAEPTIQRSGENRLMVQLPDITDLELVKKTIGSVAKLEFRLVADPSGSDSVEMRMKEGGQIRVQDQALMTGSEIDKATVDINPQTNEIGVSLKLTSSGARIFDRVTSENVGKQLAIVLDNTVQSAPVIRERIGGGTASITGNFTKQDAHLLALVLRSGALPAPLVFEEQRTVGASLGADAIRSGVEASLAGALLVILFMIFYYRKAGVQAVVCTGLNILFLLVLLSLFGATLTLPGIAGLALTIGMAVDANVIIFERIREELRAGATTKAAIDAGFHKAHWTILDANLTTLLSGVVLYAFGTGPIKGFAVTLCLGILTTLFAALYISRLGFEVIEMKNAKGELSI